MARLELKFVYYHVAVQHIIRNITATPFNSSLKLFTKDYY